MNTTTILIIILATGLAALFFALGQLRQLYNQHRAYNKKLQRNTRRLSNQIEYMLDQSYELDEHIEVRKQQIERNNRMILVILVVMLVIAFFLAYTDE